MDNQFSGILFILLILIGIVFQHFNNIRKQKKRIQETWGEIPVTTVRDKEESLYQSYTQLKEHLTYASEIDDISWYDLDLFQVFKKINRTHSSVGSEGLYRQLRLFDFNGKKQEENEKLIKFYQENPKVRERIEYIFSRLGKKRSQFSCSFLD